MPNVQRQVSKFRILASLWSHATPGRVSGFKSTQKKLGLWKIAGAVMWVLHEVLGLKEERMIAPMDKKRGRVLLNEIMQGGNFGHYDANNRSAQSRIGKNIERINRDIRLIRYFPSECLWEPVFRVYHNIWRMKYN